MIERNLPLNANALGGDHHTLIKIGNSAKRLQTIFVAIFVKNDRTRWVHAIDRLNYH
jgi:hypothetical protein